MSDTELTVVDAQVPAIPEEFVGAGLEAMEQEDLVIPRARVLQPSSLGGGERGHFCFNLTGETKAQVHGVLVNWTKGRVYWSSDLKAPPICASDDSKMPRRQVEGCGPTCDKCLYSQWGETKDDPSACSLQFNFLIADIDEGNAPFILSVAGASIKRVKPIISYFSLKRKPLFAEPVVISTVLVTDDKGRYYVVIMQRDGGHDAFDWRPYAEMYKAYRSLSIRADADREGFAAEARAQEAAPEEPDADLPEGLADALDGSKRLF